MQGPAAAPTSSLVVVWGVSSSTETRRRNHESSQWPRISCVTSTLFCSLYATISFQPWKVREDCRCFSMHFHGLGTSCNQLWKFPLAEKRPLTCCIKELTHQSSQTRESRQWAAFVLPGTQWWQPTHLGQWHLWYCWSSHWRKPASD
jgi:hypothetical protein